MMPTEIDWAAEFDALAKRVDNDAGLDEVMRNTIVQHCNVVCSDLRGCASYKLGYQLAIGTPSINSQPQVVAIPYLIGDVQRGWRDAKLMMKTRN